MLPLSPPATEKDYYFNLADGEGVADLFDVTTMQIWTVPTTYVYSATTPCLHSLLCHLHSPTLTILPLHSLHSLLCHLHLLLCHYSHLQSLHPSTITTLPLHSLICHYTHLHSLLYHNTHLHSLHWHYTHLHWNYTLHTLTTLTLQPTYLLHVSPPLPTTTTTSTTTTNAIATPSTVTTHPGKY